MCGLRAENLAELFTGLASMAAEVVGGLGLTLRCL